MTVINIERVKNGWVVRPYEPNSHCCPVASEVYVYTNIADLQAALPMLLAFAEPPGAVAFSQVVIANNPS